MANKIIESDRNKAKYISYNNKYNPVFWKHTQYERKIFKNLTTSIARTYIEENNINKLIVESCTKTHYINKKIWKYCNSNIR